MKEDTDKLPVTQESISVWLGLTLYFVAFILLGSVFSSIVYLVLDIPVGEVSPEQDWLKSICLELSMLAAVVFSTLLLLRSFDHRPWTDIGLSIRGRYTDVLWGILVAVALYGIGFAFLFLTGQVQVTSLRFDGPALVGSWCFFVLVSLCEEIMTRGYILGRLLRTRINKFLSLFISSALFALLHIFNPHMALLPMLNLVLAGMLLGVSFLYTRNLAFPISLHLFWNWIQGPVLGFEVSGTAPGNSLLMLRFPQSNIINGGAFGFEGSVVCTVLLLLFIGILIYWFEKRK